MGTGTSKFSFILKALLYAVVAVLCWSVISSLLIRHNNKRTTEAIAAGARTVTAFHRAGYRVTPPETCAVLLNALARGRAVLPQLRSRYRPLAVTTARRITLPRVPVYELNVPVAGTYHAAAGTTAERLYLFVDAVMPENGYPDIVLMGSDGRMDTLAVSSTYERQAAFYENGRRTDMVMLPLPDAYRRTAVERVAVTVATPPGTVRGMSLQVPGTKRGRSIPLRFGEIVTIAGMPFRLGGAGSAGRDRRFHVPAYGAFSAFKVLVRPDTVGETVIIRLFLTGNPVPREHHFKISELPVVDGIPGTVAAGFAADGPESTLFFDIRADAGPVSVIAVTAEEVIDAVRPPVPGFHSNAGGALVAGGVLKAGLAGCVWQAADGAPGIRIPGTGRTVRAVYTPVIPEWVVGILFSVLATAVIVLLLVRGYRRSRR